ncbi:MAG: LysM peptidoglycan-binding domain-containing protein [Planctomycetota bacterium]|nr:LysM peptidoglycan-binding domain-containing protein [Planctomycetota bacterium]
MRALTVVVLVAVASMLVVGCGPKKEELPPLEPVDGQPAAVAVPGGAAKSPVTVETMPPPPVAKPRPMTPEKPAGNNPPAADPAAGQSYEVKAGDTLYTLAKRFYGDGKLWTRIADANKDKIKDVSHIPIGTMLTIPPK